METWLFGLSMRSVSDTFNLTSYLFPSSNTVFFQCDSSASETDPMFRILGKGFFASTVGGWKAVLNVHGKTQMPKSSSPFLCMLFH